MASLLNCVTLGQVRFFVFKPFHAYLLSRLVLSLNGVLATNAFHVFYFILNFIFACAGSLLLHVGFLL